MTSSTTPSSRNNCRPRFASTNPFATLVMRRPLSTSTPRASLISSSAASAATPALGKSRRCAWRAAFPSGAAACWNAASGAFTTSPSLPCPATLCRATFPPANGIGKKTSSIRPSKSLPAARFPSPPHQDSAIMSAVTSSNAGPPRRKPGVPADSRFLRISLPILAAVALSCFPSLALSQSSIALLPGPKPPDPPAKWKQLVGIYFDEESKHTFVLLERDRKLFWRDEKGVSREFSVYNETVFPPSEGESAIGHSIARDNAGKITGFCYLNFCYVRTDPGLDPSHSYHIAPSRPLDELRREALAASPPGEKGPFRKADLVELAPLDQSIHLDIRSATPNASLGTPAYSPARASPHPP